MTNRKKSGFELCLSFMWLAVNFVMFYGNPDVLWTGDTREVLAEPRRVDACSGGPTAVGHVLAPVHACWGDPGAPAGCGWQLSPGPPVEGLMQRLLGKEALKARLRGHWGGRALVEARAPVLHVCPVLSWGLQFSTRPPPRDFRLSVV